ncbi:MAG: alpha/beta fold hydrolase [Gammaproteobacteria bacterium]|nr:alpha/beta fold hydrolase [Gammaproteobacteria bacterium]MBT8436310.1 alpha/beta fold hydrolase [Gammaproteobacteria bacterium]
MKVVFSHGKESGPWGFKIKRLAEIARQQGCDVDSIDYTDLMDPDLRVERLLAALEAEADEIVLVGSSMGGYVALVASETVAAEGIFLMAPALYMAGFKRQQHDSRSSRIEIVHAWSDDVIPAEHSIKYARDADCTLHLVSGDHALNGVIETVERLFRSFLAGVLRA